ncbi:hypothetical protein L0337_35350 [candidate division KSB1 bacterium]|nr:hypothetical protein [candidate division KSB1 bacterium]
MSKIIEETTANGLVVPNTVLEQGGIEEGTKVVIESYNKTIVIKPEALNARDIAKRARIFLLWKVGDATDVKLPIKEGNKWRVTVVLPYLKKELGQLTYTLDGTLVPEESNTAEQLKAKANED